MSTFQVVHESDTITRIKYKKQEVILVGTAHVSPESIDEVRGLIETEKPGRVCVEIDAGRYKTMSQEKSWENMDIQKVLKEKKGFLLLVNLVLSSFQRRIGKNVGVKPGEEMKAAIDAAEESGIPFSFSDRPIQTTLTRAWRKSNLWNKMKLLSVLVGTAFSNEEVDEKEIEALKESNALQQMMEELANYLPSIKKVLIDERDQFLAGNIFSCKEDKILAVVGAGHAPGIIQWLEDLSKGEKEVDLDEISEIPPKKFFAKAAPWFIPVIVLGVFVAGFFLKGFEGGLKMVLVWVLSNGVLAMLGSIIALARPLTIIISFLAAPITSMNPTIGVGFVTGLLEYFFRKPRICDLEHLQEDASSVKGWYKNRVTRILLVFLLSSIGSVIGTFVAIPYLSVLLGVK